MPSASTETADEGGNPGFDRLTRIYERLGLDPEQAEAAAAADVACGWTIREFPG